MAIHIETRNLFFDNVNTNLIVFIISFMAHEDYTKKLLEREFSIFADYEEYKWR